MPVSEREGFRAKGNLGAAVEPPLEVVFLAPAMGRHTLARGERGESLSFLLANQIFATGCTPLPGTVPNTRTIPLEIDRGRLRAYFGKRGGTT